MTTGDLDEDFDVGDTGRARVPEVLRRRPHQRPSGDALGGVDHRRERGPAVERAGGGEDTWVEREAPATRVVGCLEPEPVLRPHP